MAWTLDESDGEFDITSPTKQEGARRGLDREENSRETQVCEVYGDQLKEKLRSGPEEPGAEWVCLLLAE